MSTKHEFSSEMFVAVYWSYNKWYTITLVDHTVVKVLDFSPAI